ncbi:unnamed protein product, partial [Ixodes persulcatus]
VENSPETCVKLAKAYKGVSHLSDSESKTSAIAREYVFKWALLKLVFIADYAKTYDKMRHLSRIIASNMNYNVGLRIFCALHKTVQVNTDGDPVLHYNNAVAELWKYTPVEFLSSGNDESDDDSEVDEFVTDTNNRLVPSAPKRRRREFDEYEDNENRPRNVPCRVVKIQNELLFQMTEEDKETSNWLLTELTKAMGRVTFVYSEYIKRLLRTNKIGMLMHNKRSDSYGVLKYNESTGTMMVNSLSTLLLELQMVAIKTCFEYESAADNITPFDLCYKFLEKTTKCLEKKLDFSNLNTYLQSYANTHTVKLTSNRHLILPNKQTYDLYTAQYIAWDPSQVCMVRSWCDLNLGRGELLDHWYTEIHPTRGGFEYRCKMLRNAVESAWKVFGQNGLGHELHNVVTTITPKVCNKIKEYDDTDKFMEAFLDDLCSNPSNRFKDYISMDDVEEPTRVTRDSVPTQSKVDELNVATEKIKQKFMSTEKAWKFGLYSSTAVYLLSIRVLLKRHPELYSAVMNTACYSSGEDDDGGPVLFVQSKLTWEQLVWTMLIELFGSAEQARMVLEFLALGLSTDSNGRLIMLMHGEVANGRSMFIGMLHYIFGKDSRLIRILPLNFFTSEAYNRRDATFRSNAEEIRFVIENDIPVLDMNESGRKKFKQFTGDGRVSNSQPYDRCDSDFRISAKLVTSSNYIPYISTTMLAGQSQLMIIPTVSRFIKGKAALRKQLLDHLSADRYCRLLFGTQYPTLMGDYVKEMNQQANTMFTLPWASLDARNTLFPEHHRNILDRSFSSDLMSAPCSIPSQRWLLGNLTLMRDSAQEKLGAALCRILLDHVVPSMGGLQNTSVTVQKLENYVRKNVNLFGSYKNVMIIILKRLIIYRKGYAIDVDILHPTVSQELTNEKETLQAVLFGRFKRAGLEAFAAVENACKTLDSFCVMLTKCNFDITNNGHAMTLNDFQWITDLREDKDKLDVSPIEAMVLRDDLRKYVPPNGMLHGPSEEDVSDIRTRCLKSPIVHSDFVYGTL